MRLEREVPGGRVFVAHVDAGDEAVGRRLLERLEAPASALPAGGSVMVDLEWATVRLRATGKHVVADEPDYGLGGDRYHASLTLTARICAAQARLATRLHVTPAPVTATQFVQVSTAAMQDGSVVGHRCDDERDPFTGWTIVSSADVLDEARFGYHTVRELARDRPAWMVALILPRSWSFRFEGDSLVDCVSRAGETHAIGLNVPLHVPL